MSLCCYGCGQLAKHQFKNGKNCCSVLACQCPAIRVKNSSNLKATLSSSNIKRRSPRYWLGKTSPTKGKNYEQLYGINNANKIKTKLSLAKKGKTTGIASTYEKEMARRKKISLSMKNNPKVGGYRFGSGRGKKGRYKGFWCDSSWELVYIIYCIEHDIRIERNWSKFKYIWNNQVRYWIPDFIENSVYVEIKGYLTDKVYAKIKQFPYTLKVITENEIRTYLDYVLTKYGKNFISLYENRGELDSGESHTALKAASG